MTVSQNRQAVADRVDLIQEMGNEDDAHALCPEVAHDLEKQLYLIVIQ